MNRVNVYRFWVSDSEKTKNILVPCAATASAISKIEGARAINVTVKEVEDYRVDSDGFLIE
jgi:hypothetical protein